jgi:hypothetical protein
MVFTYMKNILFKKIIYIPLFIIVLGMSIAVTENKPNRNLYVASSRDIGLEYFSVDSSLKLVYKSNFGEALSIIEKRGNDYVLDMRNDDFFFVQTVLELL